MKNKAYSKEKAVGKATAEHGNQMISGGKDKSVNVEIIEFYPKHNKKNKHHLGSMHIYLPDSDIDIRGVTVLAGSKGITCWLPSFVGQCHKTGKAIRYSVIGFANSKTQRGLLNKLQADLPKFLTEWFDDHPEAEEFRKKAGL